MSYEHITVVGNIGSVEIHTARNGAVYAKITVAANKGTGANKKATWYNVLLFSKLAEDPEMLKRVFTPGRLVVVAGRPQTAAYIKGDGTAGLDNAILAGSLPQLLDNKPAENRAPAPGTAPGTSRA